MSRTLRRLIPSPAMIVALVALVLSLGSSGYAQRFVPAITGEDIDNNTVSGADIRNTSLTRKDIRKRSLRGRKFELNSVGGKAIKESGLEPVRRAFFADSAEGLDLWAVVDEFGELDRPLNVGTVAAKADPGAVGRYNVIFDSDVSSCSYQATIGSPSDGLQDQTSPMEISVSSLQDNKNGVRVRTANGTTNAEQASGFHLAVSC